MLVYDNSLIGIPESYCVSAVDEKPDQSGGDSGVQSPFDGDLTRRIQSRLEAFEFFLLAAEGDDGADGRDDLFGDASAHGVRRQLPGRETGLDLAQGARRHDGQWHGDERHQRQLPSVEEGDSDADQGDG